MSPSHWLQNIDKYQQFKPEEKEDDLDATDDGKPTKESHGASYETQLTLELDLRVSLNLVEGRCVKEDVNKLQGRVRLVL